MIDKLLAQRVLGRAQASGGDYAELFLEDSVRASVNMVDGAVDTAISGRRYGAGVRIFKGFKSVYATTNDLSEDGLMACAGRAAAAIAELGADVAVTLRPTAVGNAHPCLITPASVALKRKTDLLRVGNKAIMGHSKEIAQAVLTLTEWDQNVLIASTDDVFACDRRVYTRLRAQAVASGNGENQVGYNAPGRHMGFECFENGEIDVKKAGIIAAKRAVTMLHAGPCQAGRMPVAIENGFGGVIFHEACGHSLEATSVAVGFSEFSGRLGETVAGAKVTAIDDGTLKNNWGSMNIDDEGTPTRRNVLIENGVLKGYLIDKLGARRMNMAPTGSSRRESYQLAPTSRMSNTYIDNGPDKNADIIASIELGLYAASMGGGSVNPATGEFNFAVNEGYMVRNGKIAEPVRGASLIGRGSEVLQNIDMVGQNLDHGQGMCGSLSGSVPTNCGQPLLRVREITVGGR